MTAMNESLLADPFERVLQANCAPVQVRAIERGESGSTLWRVIHESGFLDALLPESRGGAGLGLRDVHPLIELGGRYAMPLPFAQTMIARALLDEANVMVPEEPIILAGGHAEVLDGSVRCVNVAHAMTAHWALVQLEKKTRLLPTAQAQRESFAPNSLAANLTWPAQVVDASMAVNIPVVDALLLEACVLAPMIAGAMASAFRMTVQYANERVQFGRTLSKFQAIQHQIAVMAEQAALARTAARLGCDVEGLQPKPHKVSIAKAVTSEAAPTIAAMAHAVHGAIGMTAEYDLQLFTRRLHEWRLCAGSEVYWNRRVGAAMIASGQNRVLDFIR